MNDDPSSMKIRIIKRPVGTVDGIVLARYEPGTIYDVSASLADYLVVQGYAVPSNGQPRPCVLIVEDEPYVQTTLCATLTLTGFNTLRAGNVDDALRILGTELVDAMTLDMKLPDSTGMQRSGLTLLKFLRSDPAYRTLPVIVLTGAGLTSEEENLIQRLGAHVFRKPAPYKAIIDQLMVLL
jgi:CheY-like chemotaxis protein